MGDQMWNTTINPLINTTIKNETVYKPESRIVNMGKVQYLYHGRVKYLPSCLAVRSKEKSPSSVPNTSFSESRDDKCMITWYLFLMNNKCMTEIMTE